MTILSIDFRHSVSKIGQSNKKNNKDQLYIKKTNNNQVTFIPRRKKL